MDLATRLQERRNQLRQWQNADPNPSLPLCYDQNHNHENIFQKQIPTICYSTRRVLDIGMDTYHFDTRFLVKTKVENRAFVRGGICKLNDVSQPSGCIIDFWMIPVPSNYTLIGNFIFGDDRRDAVVLNLNSQQLHKIVADDL